MGEGAKRSFRDSFSKAIGSAANAMKHEPWLVCDSGSAISSSFGEDSNNSITSSTSSDLIEDASSSTSDSSSPSQLSNGPLYELSELMAQLPIKRGLSKHYDGKSQSFTSLCSVRCSDDLAKTENPCRKKMKTCKSYGGGLETRKSCTPKPLISKKSSRGSALSLGKRGSFMSSSSRPPVPVQRNQCNRKLSFVFI